MFVDRKNEKLASLFCLTKTSLDSLDVSLRRLSHPNPKNV